MEHGRIFISYSRVNSEFALKLARDLKSAGIDIWIDQVDIPTGARWDDVLERALEECSVFLILLSPESIGSQNVKDEIGYAIDSNKRILPVIVKPCTVPLRLRRFQYVDFAKKSYEESLSDMRMLIGNGQESSLIISRTEGTAVNTLVPTMASPRQIAIASTKVRPKLPIKLTIFGMGLVLAAVAGTMVFMVGKSASFTVDQDRQLTEVVASPTVTIPLSYSNYLNSNTKAFLYPTETLTSENGRYELALHVDGNLVLKDKGNPVWSSKTADSYDILYLQMQEDGNLVMYGDNLRFIWSSDTSAEQSASEYILLLQNDGNLVIFTINGERVWALK